VWCCWPPSRTSSSGTRWHDATTAGVGEGVEAWARPSRVLLLLLLLLEGVSCRAPGPLVTWTSCGVTLWHGRG
jgi:hypothetical protein